MKQHHETTAEPRTVLLRTGSRMPVLGLGTWELVNDTPGTVAHAFELGYRMVDTAVDYGSQSGIGEAIRQHPIRRDELYIVIKVEETDDAYDATRQYLDELQLDYADLVLIHRPPASGAGEQLWQGLMQAKRQGIARDIGVSNYDADLIRELTSATGEAPAVNQIEWTPFGHSIDMLRFCQAEQIVLQAYSPLTRATRLEDETLTGIARRYGKTAAQVLLRWNVQLGSVPLPKANRKSHLEENVDVFDFAISDNDMNTLSGLNTHWSALGSLPYV